MNDRTLFMRLCWLLNDIHLSKMAAMLRKRVAHTEDIVEIKYPNPDQVGYEGWIKHPKYGVLAFRRLDGSVQWEW